MKTTRNKDVVTYVDGVKVTICAYRGPRGFTPRAVKKSVSSKATPTK